MTTKTTRKTTMDYTVDELKFFMLWYLKAYARRKKKPPKVERELYEKLIVDLREFEKDEDDDTDMGDIDLDG